MALICVVGFSLAAAAGTSLLSVGAGGGAAPAAQEQGGVLLAQAGADGRDARRERRRAERRAQRQAERLDARRAQRREARAQERERARERLLAQVVQPADATAADRARWASQRASVPPEDAAVERVSMNAPASGPAPLRAPGGAVDPAAVEAYASVTEPGRVSDTLPFHEGGPQMEALSEGWSRIPAGGSVVLRARAVPGGPISFHSFDGGAFENGLPVITQVADERGDTHSRKFSGGASAFQPSLIERIVSLAVEYVRECV